jgi:hypothetical protein
VSVGQVQFAIGKPLTLIGGKQLVDLLAWHGNGRYVLHSARPRTNSPVQTDSP